MASKGLLELDFEAHGIEQIGRERLRKIRVQYLKSQLRDQGRMGTQGLQHFRFETACYVVLEKLRFLHIQIVGSMLQ